MVESEPVPISSQSKIKYTPIPELVTFYPVSESLKQKPYPVEGVTPSHRRE